MNVFVFDIETVPDVEAGRAIYELHDLDDAEVAQAMFHLNRQKTGSEFLPHYLHQIVAISAVFRFRDSVKVWTLGDMDSDEKEVVQRFFDGIDKYAPTLVSWNGGGFDLPVLNYRALKYGISAPQYWDTGEMDNSSRWNNYTSRYHARHTDVMDVMAMYTGRANAPLDHIATMLGFPGKMGMSGGKVWDEFLAGNIRGIRDYCETDVLNTYLVYLRFELMRGRIDQTRYERECELLKDILTTSGETHLQSFLQHWESGSAGKGTN
ncbi:3'-5' exonuclease [Pleionea sp. CnH1-48]|uniref:3'-5' exonuclease n=1 Tax=Pleionea sp. CnH1-48 TaxID=2954494 RepID=UPI0020973371|nr:3'-5' exonuclease [Pleionea sp. CnH1-48]MCO7223892.1 3'-5' exonuclease [Pleionea sp. CnH1-48]